MIARCSARMVQIHTQDSGAVAVSDAAAESLRSALFRPGHTATCKCQAGECDRGQCDELRIHDDKGQKVACFYGRDWRAHDSEVGNVRGLVVYRAPSAQHASTQDGGSELVNVTPDAQRAGLRAINEANRQHWAAREGTWLHQQQQK